jgi:hypothetical protein
LTDVDWAEMTRDVEPPENYQPKEKGCFQKVAQLPVAILIAAALIITPFFNG